METVYLEIIGTIERLHRQFLEVVKRELDRIGIEDINNVQTLILFNIGRDEVTVGELTARGYYLGSNVSYNLKKMVEQGYLEQKRSTHDRRSVRVSASEKGRDLCARIAEMYKRHIIDLSEHGIGDADLKETLETLRGLGRFWVEEAREVTAIVPFPAIAARAN